MRLILIAVLLVATGCNGLLLPKRQPRLSLYETQYARWMLELESADYKEVDVEPVVPGPAPAPSVHKCDCPSVCSKDRAFTCTCTTTPCDNPDCRRYKKTGDAVPQDAAILPELTPEQPAPIAAVDPPAVAAADMFTLWRENLPPSCIVVCTQPGCPPCKTGAREIIAPLVATGWHIVTVDISYSPELADAMGVDSTPTYIGFSDGVEVGRTQNPAAPPLRTAWPIIEGWFRPKATTAQAAPAQFDPDAFIAQWFRGRLWRHADTVRQHLAAHGMSDDMLAPMDTQKQERLHAAIHEMELTLPRMQNKASVVPSTAPNPPTE